MRETTCPACGFSVAIPFLEECLQPLVTLAWPETAEAAQAMVGLPMDFVQCVDCGHIFNVAFDYAAVPYTSKPNLMFNRGALWSGFIRDLQQELLSYLPKHPVVVEIGHGDGSFLAALAEQHPDGAFIGFDPHGVKQGHPRVEFRAEYFDPVIHLPELQPDLIISRHVLEHLTNPLGFLQRIAFVGLSLNLHPFAYFEVPCVDRVLETKRTVDFYYEHNSHFTTSSFTRMLERCPAKVVKIGHGYDGEVVYGLLEITGHAEQLRTAYAAQRYYAATQDSLATICAQLAVLHAAGQRVAIWGGTGKSAAFINRYGLDAERFPLVVDSDPEKVNTYVPGTGQRIRFRDALHEQPVDVVIIPPQWRARDILQEMTREKIAFRTILIEHDGRLVDSLKDSNPYS